MIVEVKTPARLHLGLIELGGHFGRIYGGLGVAVDRPVCHVKIETSDKLEILGKEVEYVTETVNLLTKKIRLEVKEKISVLEAIPAHKGLGSRTQLSLAVATALAKIHKLNTSTMQLARTLGRGTVSMVGTAVFEKGGFIIEFPRRASNGHGGHILRFDFPEEWSFVVAYSLTESGLSDEVEKKILNSLEPMDEVKCSKISHLVLVRLLPALIEKDLKGFGDALTEIQRLVGEHFSTVQGDVYKNRKAIDLLAEYGAVGVGQSSWGPTVYGLFASFEEAEKKASYLAQRLGSGWRVFAAKPANKGAHILIAP